jgi:hypothetical protein
LGVSNYFFTFAAYNYLFRQSTLFILKHIPETREIIDIFFYQALHYDVRRGPHSVGSHVRDAAAYVCWAFGRAYYHTDMRNVLEELAPHLLTVACYDREVFISFIPFSRDALFWIVLLLVNRMSN